MTGGFLLDTNVPSELTRIKPDPRVARWLQTADDSLLYLSVISIGEFCKGFTIHPEQHRRAGLRQWLDNTLPPVVRRTYPAGEQSDCGKMGHTRRAVPVEGVGDQCPGRLDCGNGS